jgi:hypothetical protein
MVSFAPRPYARSIAVKIMVPTGRATNASAKIANDHRVPCSGLRCGNTSDGNTSTDAMA